MLILSKIVEGGVTVLSILNSATESLKLRRILC